MAFLTFARDEHGNYTRTIGEAPSTCFACHLDTASGEAEPINLGTKGGVCRTDGRTILGADDRAGLALILSMVVEKVPGVYYLFVGEEEGCVGSSALSRREGLPSSVTKCISFDRKGKTSIVTHQCGGRTCSDTFAEALAAELNHFGFSYSPDPTGVYTDSMEFAGQVSECTNISVGYEAQHTTEETQDLAFLSCLLGACVQVDWESLPAERVAGEAEEEEGVGYGGSWGSGWEYSQEDLYRDHSPYEAVAYDAIENIADGWELGMPIDRTDIYALVQSKACDTVDMIELLLQELQRVRWKEDI